MTQCKTESLEFHALGSREIVAHFDGGDISSDAGGLMLREVEKRTGILRGFAACFTDYRDPEAIEHTVEDLVGQRTYGLCLGYEDLNDHDQLRSDPLIALMVGKKDPKGEHRREQRDRGKALAGKSTLNRLGTHRRRRRSVGAIQEDRDESGIDRSAHGRSFPKGASACTRTDHSGCGCD
jgi:hypothetical protein